jgi:hypothetical protein
MSGNSRACERGGAVLNITGDRKRVDNLGGKYATHF